MIAGALYFAIVFGAGFILGAIRTFWIVPQLGSRRAELAEAPIMCGVTIVAARYVIHQWMVPPQGSARLVMGLTALGLVILSEIALVYRMRHMTLRTYVARHDPIAGIVYLTLLGWLTIYPMLVR